MTATPIKTRFAPSPTGLLHLGNIRTALFNALLAHGRGGVFLLRIEDTDAMRGHERYATALMEDLEWLGLGWDEGPVRGGAAGPYAQSERSTIYRKYFAQLESAKVAYPCFCTEQELKVERKTQLSAGQPPRYSGKCRRLTAAEVADRQARGLAATLRFHVADGKTVEFEDRVRGPQRFATSDIGDFVIRRSDGTPAFFFCNAVDDALMGVTLVVRGEDHLTNTPRQLLLLEALKLRAPEYAHIPLVVGADGAPLSKRTGSKSTQELRAAGFLPVAINNYLARVGHTYDDNHLLPMSDLAAKFDIARVHHSPARFDETQLLHWQREAVRAASVAELWMWAGSDVHALIPATEHDSFIEAVRSNVTFPADVLHWARVVYTDDVPISEGARSAVKESNRGFFEHSLKALSAHQTDFRQLSAVLGQQTGYTGKRLYRPLRAALTGEVDGPEMARLLPLIGVDRARARLQRAIESAQ